MKLCDDLPRAGNPAAIVVPRMNRASVFNRDCRCVSTDVPLVQRWIERELRNQGIEAPLIDTHPHLFATQAVFLDAKHWKQADALIDAVETVVTSPPYQEAVLANAPLIAQLEDSAKGAFLGYDFHIAADGPKLIEINTNAGGAMLNVLLLRAQQACCPEVATVTPTTDEVAAIESKFIAMFEQEYALRRPGHILRRIVIVDDRPHAQFLFPEFLLFKRAFEASGFEAVIADPGELSFDGTHLRHEDKVVDLIYNRLTDFYLERPEHVHLAEAYRSAAVVVTPHPRSHALYANKRNLALLSDEHVLCKLDIERSVIQTLLRHIPRTELTSAHPRERWWSERKQWFFKPAGGYAARGAYRGDKLTRKVFDDVMTGDYVAQAIVPASQRHCDAGADPLRWDLRVYAYGRTPLLTAARLYAGQTTNFRTLNGGFAPVFITSDATAPIAPPC